MERVANCTIYKSFGVDMDSLPVVGSDILKQEACYQAFDGTPNGNALLCADLGRKALLCCNEKCVRRKEQPAPLPL